MMIRHALPPFFLVLGLSFGPIVAAQEPPALVPAAPGLGMTRSQTEIVAVERAFSARSLEKGVAASFSEFFSAEGIGFWPGAVNMREHLKPQLSLPTPQTTLAWEPAFVDLAAAGDLAISTGPSLFTDQTGSRPPSFGYFFSLWRRQPDGKYQVELDFGVDVPSLAQPKVIAIASQLSQPPRRQPPAKILQAELLKIDGELSAAITEKGYRAGLEGRLGHDVRILRDGFLPRVGFKETLEHFAAHDEKPTFQPRVASGSISSDLGYVYGEYTRGTDKGWYVRVWKRMAIGWRVVADFMTAPLPATAG